MDPYEKLLSPRRDLRRSSRHNHGDNDKGGEASEGGGGASGGKSSGSECKKGEEDENKEHKGEQVGLLKVICIIIALAELRLGGCSPKSNTRLTDTIFIVPGVTQNHFNTTG